MLRYHKSNPYGQLKIVMLGCFYPEDYFDCLADPEIRSGLMKIAREIEEDLCYFQKVLESHDIQVLRPNIPSKQQFVDTWIQTGRFLTPPLQPRNHHSVIGDKIYQISVAEETAHVNAVLPGVQDIHESALQLFLRGCEQNRDCYNTNTDTWYCREKYLELAGPDWPTFHEYVGGQRSDILSIKKELEHFEDALCYETRSFHRITGPNIFPVNERLFVDCKEYFDYGSWARQHIEFSGEIVILNSKADHTDGCFVVLGKNVVIGVVPGIDYDRFFPGYRVVPAADSYQATVLKRKAVGSFMMKNWWVPGEEHNVRLTNHVNTYMQNFIGTAYETSFDLNVLALNQDTVCGIVCDPAVVKNLNDCGIEVIEIPWRHRFFVDCGLHCITLDLYREDH